MAGFSPTSSSVSGAPGQHNYTFALSALTTLFFMWGFNLPERHLDPAFKRSFRPKLHPGHVDSVLFLRRLLFGVITRRPIGEKSGL